MARGDPRRTPLGWAQRGVCREAAVDRHPQHYPIVKDAPDLPVPFELETNPDGTQTALLGPGCIDHKQLAELLNELACQRLRLRCDCTTCVIRAVNAREYECTSSPA